MISGAGTLGRRGDAIAVLVVNVFEYHYSAFVLGLVLHWASAGREGEPAHG